MFPLIAYSQKFQVDKGKLETLLQAYFYTLPACDSTVIAFRHALDSANRQLNTADKMIQLKELESETWEKRFNNSKQIHKSELKKTRKLTLQVSIIAVVEFLVLLIVL